MDISGIEVRRVLVDNVISCDILSISAFSKMGISEQNLKPCMDGLVSFTGHEATIKGMITLPLTLGEWPKAATEIVDFFHFLRFLQSIMLSWAARRRQLFERSFDKAPDQGLEKCVATSQP